MVDWQNAHLFLAHKNFATKYLISGVSRLHSIKTRFHLKHHSKNYFVSFKYLWILLGLEFYLDFILKAFLNHKLMSLSIDALTSALLGCHQSAHCAPEEMAPAVSGWRRLTERRRRRLVTSVKVSFLHPPPVSTDTTATDSHIMITTHRHTNHDSLIDWILQQETQFLKHL